MNDLQKSILAVLVTMAQPAKQGAAELEKAKGKIEGAYGIAMQAAAMSGDLETFLEAYSMLENNIRKNVGNLAVRFGAEKRDKVDKKGNKYKLPNSVTTAKSRIKAAFDLNVAFTVDGAPLEVDSDGNPENLRSYTEVKDEVKATQDLAKEEKAQAAIAQLTGDDKVRHEVAELCNLIVKSLPDMQGAELSNLHTGLAAVVLGEFETIEEPEQEQAQAASA